MSYLDGTFELSLHDVNNGIISDARVNDYAAFPICTVFLDSIGETKTEKVNNLVELARKRGFGPQAILDYQQSFRTAFVHGAYNEVGSISEARGDPEFYEALLLGTNLRHRISFAKEYARPDRWVIRLCDDSTPRMIVNAILVLDPLKEEPESFWARYTFLPPNSLTCERIFPLTRFLRLSTQLHEMRHLVHIRSGDSSDEESWCAELDCDLFARGRIREGLSGIGKDPTAILDVHKAWRYATLLCAAPSHRIAHALDNESRVLVNYEEIKAVTGQILDCLKKQLFPQERRNSLILPTRITEVDPALTFSMLRRLRGEGAFKDTAELIVNRVLDSVELFSRDFTRHPSVVNKCYAVRAPV